MAVFTTAFTFYIAYLFLNKGLSFYFNIGTGFENPVICFKTTGPGLLFCLMIAILYPLAFIYTIAYARVNNMKNQESFFCFFHFTITSGLALGLSANLITMFIFYEIITLVTYPLVCHNRDLEAQRSGRTYLMHLVISASLLLLPAIIIIQSTIGSTNFINGGLFVGYQISKLKINILFAMIVFGIAKTAIFPLHNWLPNAMVAPTPVSAILHAVIVVKSGLFCLISVIYFTFGPHLLRNNLFTFYHENWLTWLAAITILIMSLTAIFQDKIKKRLAYSTVSQLSYAILAASILSYSSMKVAFILMIAHAFAKIILFFGAGIIHSYFHKDKLTQICGIGKQIPITMIIMCIACISLIGLPITIGFKAKYYLLLNAIKYQNLVLILIIVISTLLSVCYLFPFIYNPFFAKKQQNIAMINSLLRLDNFLLSFVMITCGAIVIGLFFMTDIIYQMLK